MIDNMCVFCRRLRDHQYEPTTDDDVVRFEPLNPVTPGHMLFIPVHHIADAAHGPATTGAVMTAAVWWGNEQGHEFNLITSVGAYATQTVLHLHVHYVPRRLNDGLHLPWTGQEKKR